MMLSFSQAYSASDEKKKEEAKPNPSIQETQQQLESIIKIHKNLQTQHQREIEEIQKIMEQARAHQKLLRELSDKSSTSSVSSATPGVDIGEAIRHEKMGVIQKEKSTETKNEDRKVKKST